MTMTRRIEGLIAAVLLLALLGSLGIHTLTARQALQWQLELRNRDAASALALALSQPHGNATALQIVAAAQFDLGHYRRLRLQAVDGRALVDLQAAASTGHAPAWFARAWPIAAPAGMAIVSGSRGVGTPRASPVGRGGACRPEMGKRLGGWGFCQRATCSIRSKRRAAARRPGCCACGGDPCAPRWHRRRRWSRVASSRPRSRGCPNCASSPAA